MNRQLVKETPAMGVFFMARMGFEIMIKGL